MNVPAVIAHDNIPAIIDRATRMLSDARTSGEVLEARDMASVAYDAAKIAGRMARAKKAHDDVLSAVYRTQADALLIEARAKSRLADEYDAAQARGEVATRQHNPGSVGHVGADDMPPATAADLGLRRDEIHEARQIRDAEAADPGIVERTLSERAAAGLEPTKAAVRQAVESVNKPFVANNSGNNEWYTPAPIIDVARAVLGGFDIDPASSEVANRIVRAARIFTAEDDGLAQEWPVGSIWINPPYAQPLMGQFADRFAAEVRRGSTGIMLVNNATETAWFQTVAAECSAICFPKSRIKFLDPEGNPSGAPLQGQAIIYCGPDADTFEGAFAGFGLVVRHG
jgi:phage N-6-adenine-methyltransferase